MQTEVTEAGPFERTLTVHLDEKELEGAKDRAARKLSQDMKVKGFRPGRAPRAVVESMVGSERLRTEAIEEALPEIVGAAIVEEQLAPVTTPAVQDIRDEDDGGVAVDILITLWPSVDDAPDYEGREIEVELPEVSVEEVDEQIDRFRSQHADLEDVARPADTGDYVMVNITALDGDDLIEEVSASDLLYEVGSQSFISGLDEMLLGASAGDIREGPGQLPEGFAEGVAGEVTLRALVKEVRGKKLPQVTDEWVSDVSEFESVDELRSTIETNIRAMKLSTAIGTFQEQLVTELSDEIDVEIPQQLIEAETEAGLHNLMHSLEPQGIDLANYLQITGQDPDTFVEDMKARAERSLRTRVVLEAVASAADISVDDADVDAAIQELAGESERDPEEVREALVASGQIESLTGDILRRKALDLVIQESKAVDADGSPVDLSLPELEDGRNENAPNSDEPDSDEPDPVEPDPVEPDPDSDTESDPDSDTESEIEATT